MSSIAIPLAILGGSDRQPGHLPPSGKDWRSLTGAKGMDIRIAGRRLIELLVERYRQSGHFDPIYIAGPKDLYRNASTDAVLVDTDAGFGGNIQAAVDTVFERHRCEQMAMSTCDILPEPTELSELFEDYRSSAPCDLWFPLIRAPEDPSALGASAWKPRYYLTPEDGDRVHVLPGHLAIFDPRALRLEFLYRLVDGAYKTRNRSVLFRRSYLLRLLIGGLLMHDLRHIATFKRPNVTWDLVRYGYFAARRLFDGSLTQREAEYSIRRVFTKRAHRLEHPSQPTRLPVLDGLSFARDIDTLEEAAALDANEVPSPALGSPEKAAR